MATHQLNYATHQLENLQLPSEETALNFNYWEVRTCNTLFHGQNWNFEQDSAPAHKPQTTQQWQKTNCPEFISTKGWHSTSPNLNCLDCKFRSNRQEMACKKRYPNIENLKRSLRKVGADLPTDVLPYWIDGWPLCVCQWR